MASKAAAEEPNNTETDEHTIARQKKRSRRVSFAETTSVHVFHRDDDYETPPDPEPSSDDHNSRSDSLHLGEHFAFLQDDSKESSQNDEETDVDGEENNCEEFVSRKSFLRPVESPSPGSTIGSATSNGEDNFFGPVSASFIKPGRLSDSAASDENHDITMDSTAFSMHFRSLARSDTGGDLNTPTRIGLSFEEKTPTHTNHESSMVLTTSKKPILDSFVAAAKSIGHGDSNDMSLIGENPHHQYDYGRLSPGLDVLLVEGSKDLLQFSSLSKPLTNTEMNSSPLNEDGEKFMELIDNHDTELGNIGNHILTQTVSAIHDKSVVTNGSSRDSPILQKLTDGLSSNTSKTQECDVSIGQTNWSPYQFKNDPLVQKNKGFDEDSQELSQPEVHLSTVRRSISSGLSDRVDQLEGLVQCDFGSPLEGFITSSSARQKLLNTSSPSKYPSMITPSHSLFGPISHEKILNVESASSIQRSISRLNMIESSPFSSTCSAKVDSQKFHSLHKNTKDPECNASPISTEKHFANSSNKDEQKSAMNSEGNGIEKFRSVQDVTHSGKHNSLKGQMSFQNMSAGVVSPMVIKGTTAESSPSRFTLSSKNTKRNHLTSENNSKGTSVNSGANPTLSEIKFDHRGDVKIINAHHKFVSSSENWLKVQPVISPRYQGNFLSRDFGLYNEDAEVKNVDPGEGSVARVNVTNAVSSAAGIDRLDSTTMVGKDPFANKISSVDTQQDISGMIGNLQNQARNSELQNHSIPGDSWCFSSPFAQTITNELPPQQNLVEWFNGRSSRDEDCGLTRNDDLSPTNVQDMPSPKSNQLTNEFGTCSTLKRKNEEIIVTSGDHIHETATVQKSPKLHKCGDCSSDLLACQNRETSAVNHQLEHWTDHYSNFSLETKSLFPPSVDKLNLREIHVLDDVLADLQRSKTYEMLSIQVESQKKSGTCNPEYNRSSEASLFLQKLVHEHAKLQLMRVKKEILLKRVQLLSSGIQESQSLKINFFSQISVQCTRRGQVVDGLQFESFPANLVDKQECQLTCDKLTAMRQILKDSERKIVKLTKSFHTSLKLKAEPNSVDTIALVNDQLKKRACCQMARQDFQLWFVDSLESMNGHHSIVLNYLAFLIQRISVTVSPVSLIAISNKLNDVKIVKNFPNMDACVAFAFVLNKETTQKYYGSRHLAQEIQITSSLLGNLLDVIEEVQLAQIELQNLSQTSFHSPSVDQLDLKLYFFDLRSGRKAALTVNISCLNWGVYPSEIIPSQLTALTDGKGTTSESFVTEIKSAIQCLRVGYFRIIRLCKCVSKVVQASSG